MFVPLMWLDILLIKTNKQTKPPNKPHKPTQTSNKTNPLVFIIVNTVGLNVLSKQAVSMCRVCSVSS